MICFCVFNVRKLRYENYGKLVKCEKPFLASDQAWKCLVHLIQNLPHDLIEDTTGAPHVHLEAVVAVSQEALWGSVPACGDVLRVRRLGVHAPTRAKVAKLQTVML